MKAGLALLIAFVLAQAGAIVSGVVTDEKTKAPISGASVLLARTDGPVAASLVGATDDRGRFTIRGVPTGTYRVFAQDDAYVRREAAGPIVVGAAAVPAIAIALTPTGVITGHVFDEHGTPASRINVRATMGGQSDVVRTNDLGEYRLFGLPPGAYVVSAERYAPPSVQGTFYIMPTPPCPDCPGEGQGRQGIAILLSTGGFIDPAALSHESYPAVFYPDARDAASARPIDVAPGAEVGGIDLRLVVQRLPGRP
jgi:hypothetical protein